MKKCAMEVSNTTGQHVPIFIYVASHVVGGTVRYSTVTKTPVLH